MNTNPGTWRSDDGSKVEWSVATKAWADATIRVLRSAGSTYGALVRYSELGEAVQVATGIQTKSLPMNWIGEVLRAITDRPHVDGEPMLSALVVNASGHVGPGYADAVEAREGLRPEDPDFHAAQERLSCYRYLGASVPADATPQLSPDLAQRRRADAAKARASAPQPKCPSCGGWKAVGVAL